MHTVSDITHCQKINAWTRCSVSLSMAATAILFFLATLPATSHAHAIMVRSSPEKDSTISQSPSQVDIWFNEKVRSAHKSLAVINSSGKRMDNKDIQQETLDPSHILISIPDLPSDTYTVRYRVISADTHVVSGKFSFTVEKP